VTGSPESPELLVDRQRRLLVEVYPEAEGMASNLRQNYPDYVETTDVVCRLIDRLCGHDSVRLREALANYVRFCDVFKQKQLDFARHGVFAEGDYDRVLQGVYEQREYMLSMYYPALLFSYVFASNYFEILRVYRQNFLPRCVAVRTSCEVGIGHGLLSGLLAARYPELRGYGIDVSPASPLVASRVFEFLGLPEGAVRVEIGNAMKGVPCADGRPYGAAVCAEVLEHVPDPLGLLRNLRGALVEGAPAFLTAALNMESVDHLYLFRTDDEVMSLVEKAGFEVVERHLGVLSRRADARDPAVARALMKRRNPATSILVVEAR
jgi:SAM-dependent methyltransferase